jgi:hypothetical protein
MATTIRLRPDMQAALREMAASTGETLQEALDRAIEERRRRLYLEGLSADYAKLRSDPAAAAEFDQENEEWDCTLSDGLEDE